GPRPSRPFYDPKPAFLGGRASKRLALFGVFAFAERHVGDLAQPGAVVVEGADMAPVDLVGAGLEMLRAEGGEAFQHRVDLELGGEEGIEGFRVVPCAAGHRGGSVVELHRVVGVTCAPVALLINSIST